MYLFSKPKQTPLNLGAINILVELKNLPSGDFYEVAPQTAMGTYVYKNAQVAKGEKESLKIPDGIYAKQIRDFVTNELPVYRGIPRWHKTWHSVVGGRDLSALGTGLYPDFSTNNSAFLPFTADKRVAIGAAISKRGMGDGDQIQFVEGYSQSLTFPVGFVVSMIARPGIHQLGFFNATEVQVKGPIAAHAYFIDGRFNMGTPLPVVFGPATQKSLHEEIADYIQTGARNDLSAMMPDPPSEMEKREYIAKYGKLIP